MSLRNLKPGTRFAPEVEALGDNRYRVVPRVRVGSACRDMGSPQIVRGEAEAYIAIEKWAQEQLARLGLAETERS